MLGECVAMERLKVINEVHSVFVVDDDECRDPVI